MPSTWEAIVARIVAQMNTITDIGRVHDSIRLTFDTEGWVGTSVATIGGEKKARVWMVRLEANDTKRADQSSMQWNQRAVIEGYLQVEADGAGEKTAIALSEQIIRTLAADLWSTRLNNTVLTGKPPKLEDNRPQFFGFVGAHYVRLVMELTTIEQ